MSQIGRKIINILSQRLGCAKKDILIMSTGIIGRQLPIKKILDSISSNSLISHSSLKSAATAIMTTDKFPKYISKSYKLGSSLISFCISITGSTLLAAVKP